MLSSPDANDADQSSFPEPVATSEASIMSSPL